MGDVIRLLPKSERKRACLIREDGAIYNSVFPPFDPIAEQRDRAFASDMRIGAESHRSEGVLS